MGWPVILSGWTGPAVLAGLALGCGGAEDPGREALPAAGATVITEIHPAHRVHRPRFISLAPKLAREGEPYQYGISAVESEEDEVHLTLVRAPEGTVLDGTVLKWTPGHGQAGRPQRFTLRAVDERGAAADQTWTITPRPEPYPEPPAWRDHH
jgi:hypothetical protein